MRVKLTFKTLSDPARIPINYNYPLHAVIYKILNNASPGYAAWLHGKGYITSDGKVMKLFTFSKFQTPGCSIEMSDIIIPKHKRCTLYVDSPMLEDFTEKFVIGLFRSQTIEIATSATYGKFQVEEIERVDYPPLHSPMKFVALSPFTASTMRNFNGALTTCYLRPDDSALNDTLKQNAIRKYQIIHKSMPPTQEFSATIDPGYMAQRGGIEGVSKIVTVKEGTSAETKIYAILAPLSISGDLGLMDTVLQAGLGNKNSLGFGMLAPVREGNDYGNHQ
jgi:CRISPR-associated endoribonuclease Cas6